MLCPCLTPPHQLPARRTASCVQHNKTLTAVCVPAPEEPADRATRLGLDPARVGRQVSQELCVHLVYVRRVTMRVGDVVGPVILDAKLAQHGRDAVQGEPVRGEVLAQHLEAKGEVQAAEELLRALRVLAEACFCVLFVSGAAWSSCCYAGGQGMSSKHAWSRRDHNTYNLPRLLSLPDLPS